MRVQGFLDIERVSPLLNHTVDLCLFYREREVMEQDYKRTNVLREAVSEADREFEESQEM